MKTQTRTLFSILSSCLLSLGAMAQAEQPVKSFCGTEAPGTGWEAVFQDLIQARRSPQNGQRTQNTVYTIPVIIHVIHGGQPVGTYPNLAQGQLISQILVLNSDYAGAGYNSGNYPLSAYSVWAANQGLSTPNVESNGRITIADCQVQFCLALKDTLGNLLAEPGIDRIDFTSRGWADPASFSNINSFRNFVNGTIKPQTIWNVTKYLNIWLTDSDVGNVNLLGYATFPPLANLSGLANLGAGTLGTSTTDGFWCYSKCFGSSSTYPGGTYYTGYTHGRTSTHEIGHWLGLRHIWGDGTCATDYCNDTPPASANNFGAPVYPFKVNSCSGNGPSGEMFMNFMDYTDDNSKYMFTTDQATRIQTAMANSPYRQLMGTHNLCAVEQVAAQASFNNITVGCTGVGVVLRNTTNGFPPSNYVWSASGGTFTPGNSVTSPSINFSTPGTYTITLTANNGTVSTITQTINITSPPMQLIASPGNTICAGSSVSLSASGVSTYTWDPLGVTGSDIVDTPTQTQTYTVTGTQVNGCKTTNTVEISISICTGINAWQNEALGFDLYPNPAKEALTLAANRNGDATVEISDALGKVLISRPLSFSQGKREQQVDLNTLPAGVYFIRLNADDGHVQFGKFIKE